ncbi:hypothetical protein SAMN04488005_3140 [Yoonia tamlensis]|uniref:Uncharacterized protein n=1 Tax=Yoonia tamlensis TaxID=390270 RepID=A0A1I6HZ46_9RHOB|nr:hypothetical protein [Yoonia tamlensis]SFR59707.1 hypothetical protein SAMN04488005_3140 [Yoonia tamlensis]
MTYFPKIVLALLAPNLAFADPFDGIYKQTAHSECALVGTDGGSLEIREDIFYGVEMQCRMINPVDIEDMDAMIYQMECSGEGQTWSERAILMNDAEAPGIIMIWNGYAFRYARCEDDEY